MWSWGGRRSWQGSDVGGGLLNTSGEECERECPAVNAVAHNRVVGLSEGEKASEVATAQAWLPRCERERRLLLFLDGEAVPLTIGEGVAGLVCRSDVEDGALQLTEGYMTIMERIVIAVRSKVDLRHSSEEEDDV